MTPNRVQILGSCQIRGADGSCPRFSLETRPNVPIPENLRRPGIQGRAEVLFVVSEDGRAENTRLISSTHPEYGAATVRAISNWQFATSSTLGAGLSDKLEYICRVKFKTR